MYRSFRATALAVSAALIFVITGCSQPETATSEAASTGAEANPGVGARAEAIRKSTATVDGERIVAAEPENWLSTGRTYDEQRHSPLDAINVDTIKDLGLAWYWDTGTKRGLESTPIVVDGVMFNSGTWSVVWAHDAKTGDLDLAAAVS